jgi:hypothetical protein
MHKLYLPDSFLAYIAQGDEKSPKSDENLHKGDDDSPQTVIFWTHYYGSLPSKKRVFRVSGGSELAKDLFKRFNLIWDENSSSCDPLAHGESPERQG